MKRLIKITLICILLQCKMHAQVGLITNNPDKSAQLDLTGATDKGLLIPDVSLTALNNPAPIVDNAPVVGLMVYNKNASLPALNGQPGGLGFYCWDGTKWCRLLLSSELGALDNLGNHTAAMALNMSNNDIKNINKQTTTTESIAKGTDGVLPQKDNIAMSADNAGNIVWQQPTGINTIDKFSFYQASTGSVLTSYQVWKDIPGLSFDYKAPESGTLVLQNVVYGRFDPSYSSSLPFPNAYFQSSDTGVRVQVFNDATLVDQNCGDVVPKTYTTTPMSGFPESSVTLLQVPVIKGVTYTIKTMCCRYYNETMFGYPLMPAPPEVQLGTITFTGGATVNSYMNAFLIATK